MPGTVMRKCAALVLFGMGVTGALAATPYDGVYEGASRGGGAGQCGAGVAFSLTIRDGAFDWRADGQSSRVTLGADGSFSGQVGRRSVTGKVADGKIAATSGTANCSYTWALTKKS